MSKRPPGILAYAQLGMVDAILLLAGMAAGWGLDQWLGTLPLFLFLGMLAGIGAGVAFTWREVRQYS